MTPFRPLLVAICVPVLIHVGTGCSTDQRALPAGSPDAATACVPPFCLVIGGADAGTPSGTIGRDGGVGDVAVGPGPGDKPKPGDKGTTPTVTVIGVPIVGQTPTTFVGGGTNGGAPLAPGCTPSSALECPTASGTCKTSATSNPTGTVQGALCAYGGPFTVASGKPAATVEYLHETAGGQDYYRFRITFDPSFVDNTYGANAIGWGDKGHTWKDLLGSDHAELELFDNRHVMVMQLKLDYIGIDTTQTCGYSSLGVSGGDGKMLIGDPKYVLGSTSSLVRNLEGCGYCTVPACNGDCRVDSPATDDKWSSNAGAPNWDYRVRYETWISAEAFGSSGFGGVNISYVHASPSKESSNTITVIPGPCPPPPGGCPPGTVVFVTETGAVTCVPEVGSPPPNGCPEGEQQVINEDGVIVCEPPGQECPEGQHWVIGKDGKLVCETTPPDCVEGQFAVIGEDGKLICETPPDCPEGLMAEIGEDGKFICDTPPDCPEGQLAVIDEDGKLVCETPTNCPPGTVAYPNAQGGYTCSSTNPIP